MNAVAAITPAAPVAHLDPTHPGVVALLAFNPFVAGSDETLAEAIRPLLAAAPELREWDVDDEYTAAEDVVSAAVRIVRGAEAKNHDWVFQAKSDLRDAQLLHRIRTHIDSLAGRICEGVTLIPSESGIVVKNASGAIVLLAPADVTAREIGIAVDAYGNGDAHGAARVAGGIRRLLDLD